MEVHQMDTNRIILYCQLFLNFLNNGIEEKPALSIIELK